MIQINYINKKHVDWPKFNINLKTVKHAKILACHDFGIQPSSLEVLGTAIQFQYIQK